MLGDVGCFGSLGLQEAAGSLVLQELSETVGTAWGHRSWWITGWARGLGLQEPTGSLGPWETPKSAVVGLMLGPASTGVNSEIRCSLHSPLP